MVLLGFGIVPPLRDSTVSMLVVGAFMLIFSSELMKPLERVK